MRVSSILLAAGLALFANAQTSSGNAAPTTTDAAAAAASSAQAEMLRCLEACKVDDVNCKAKCIAVPSPSDQQVNATTTCVAACPQGKGTEADNNAYAKCVDGCINAHYYSTSVGTPEPTGAAGSGNNNGNNNGNNGNGDNNSNGGGSQTNGNQESGTATGPAASSSTGAAAVLGVSGGVAGALGFVAAVLAL